MELRHHEFTVAAYECRAGNGGGFSNFDFRNSISGPFGGRDLGQPDSIQKLRPEILESAPAMPAAAIRGLIQRTRSLKAVRRTGGGSGETIAGRSLLLLRLSGELRAQLLVLVLEGGQRRGLVGELLGKQVIRLLRCIEVGGLLPVVKEKARCRQNQEENQQILHWTSLPP